MNPSRSPYRQLLWILPLTVAGAVIALLLYVILTPDLSLDYEGTLLMGVTVLLAILIAGTFFIRTRETGLQKQRAGALLMGGLLMGYALVLLIFLFFGGVRRYGGNGGWATPLALRANFIPFHTIGSYLSAWANDTINQNIVVENLLGNLFLFAPVGAALPCLFHRQRRFWIFLFTMLAILLLVEGVQLFTGTGSCDVDDVILNLAGAPLAYGMVAIPPVKRLLQKCYLAQP